MYPCCCVKHTGKITFKYNKRKTKTVKYTSFWYTVHEMIKKSKLNFYLYFYSIRIVSCTISYQFQLL